MVFEGNDCLNSHQKRREKSAIRALGPGQNLRYTRRLVPNWNLPYMQTSSTTSSGARPAVEATSGRPVAGKYLTFTLRREFYGMPVLQVREIIGLKSVVPMPQMPPAIKGIINLRGRIIPVMDLLTKFSMGEVTESENACIVVIQTTGLAQRQTLLGVAVDAVNEVSAISAGDIEPSPDFGVAVDTSYILGMAKTREGVVTLLDLDRLLGASADNSLHQALANASLS